jgi:signal transduction histidine kinase
MTKTQTHGGAIGLIAGTILLWSFLAGAGLLCRFDRAVFDAFMWFTPQGDRPLQAIGACPLWLEVVLLTFGGALIGWTNRMAAAPRRWVLPLYCLLIVILGYGAAAMGHWQLPVVTVVSHAAVTAGLLAAGKAFATSRTRKSLALQKEIRASQYPLAIEEIAGKIAHAIRNPLNAIELHTSLLQRPNNGAEETEAFLRIIHAETQRVDRFVSLLVRYSQPWDPLLHKMRVGEDFDTIIARLSPEILARKLQLRVNHTDAAATLVADPDRMAEMLQTLLRNSIDASDKGSAIDVATCVDGQQLLLTVKDYGKGITPENLARLFTPFFTTKTLGTGLGMCMVKKIVDGHQGSIAIQSTPAQGTVVSVRLPLVQPMGETRLAGRLPGTAGLLGKTQSGPAYRRPEKT